MKTRRTTIGIPKPLHDWLAEQARADGISANAYAVELIRREKREQAVELSTVAKRHRQAFVRLNTILTIMLDAPMAQNQLSERSKEIVNGHRNELAALLEDFS